MRRLRGRVEQLEAATAPPQAPPVIMVCFVAPAGQKPRELRGYKCGGDSYVARLSGESEDDFRARALGWAHDLALESAGNARGTIVLIEDRAKAEP